MNSKEDIQEILSFSRRPAIKPIYDLQIIFTYFDEIFAYSEEAKEVSKWIKKQLAIVQSNTRHASNLEERFIYLGKRVNEIDQELTQIKYYLRSPTKPQRREFFRTWQQFKEKIKKPWNEEETQKE